ncbi:MAG: hypothetical protein RIS35_3039 [Pseudomonadota bacterium]
MGPGRHDPRARSNQLMLMAGLDKNTPLPIRIVVHRQSRVLELAYDDGNAFRLPFELLRVYSPSAEVRGHGPGQEVLQTGKRSVDIEVVEQVGNYAIQPRFSDGHDTGIFSWDYLHWLGVNQSDLWQDYLRRLEAAGESRDPAGTVGAPAVATQVSRPRN